jgi:hypothetical protein
MASTTTPASTGIGTTSAAPANLSRSGVSQQPAGAPAQSIPFTRASTLATAKDASLLGLAAGSTNQISLQTNAFLENLILDVQMVNATGTAAVYTYDAPFNAISIKLDDPAGQNIITTVTGFALYVLNKYLPDTDCNFDPCRDPNYATPTSGNFSFRLVVPVEVRRRDAFGALNNSAANARYLLTVTTNASYGANGSAYDPNYIYQTVPAGGALAINVYVYQQYWTSPPASIVSAGQNLPTQQTPTGLGSVAFVRYERHNEVAGGGSPMIQFNNVGDIITFINFTLRGTLSAVANQRDAADWPAEFDFFVNDFQVTAWSLNDFQRAIARFYNYTTAAGGPAQAPTAGRIDQGVYPMFTFSALTDQADNWVMANQYLPTDATTKLQIRNSTWGTTGTLQYLEIFTRLVRPVSGAALYA